MTNPTPLDNDVLRRIVGSLEVAQHRTDDADESARLAALLNELRPLVPDDCEASTPTTETSSLDPAFLVELEASSLGSASARLLREDPGEDPEYSPDTPAARLGRLREAEEYLHQAALGGDGEAHVILDMLTNALGDNGLPTNCAPSGASSAPPDAESGKLGFFPSSWHTLGRQLAALHGASSLAETLQAVVEGACGLGFEFSVVNLVRPEGDLVVAAVWEQQDAHNSDCSVCELLGQVGSRESWDTFLSVGEPWGRLIFVDHERVGQAVLGDIPHLYGDTSTPIKEGDWHPQDGLLAPIYSPNGELLGVLSVDRPRDGKLPGTELRETLEMFTEQASIALSNALLRAELQRTRTRLHREHHELRNSERSLRHAFDCAPTGMAITKLRGHEHEKLTQVNEALCRMLGRTAVQLRDLSLSDLVHPDDALLLERLGREGGRAELRLARKDGPYVWAGLRTSVLADSSQGPYVVLTYVEDIQERKQHEIQLAKRPTLDALTGLPNAMEFKSALARKLCRDGTQLQSGSSGLRASHRHVAIPDGTMAGGAHVDTSVGVIFCDLDGFQAINTRFGHSAGDSVLIEVARRIQVVAGERACVARMGGDEFILLVEGIGREELGDLRDQLRMAIHPPMRIDGRAIRVGASLGTAWAACGMSVDEVLREADTVMYVEKRTKAVGADGQGSRNNRFWRPKTDVRTFALVGDRAVELRGSKIEAGQVAARQVVDGGVLSDEQLCTTLAV